MRYMRKYNINKNLQIKALKYYENYVRSKEEDSINKKVQDSLSILPKYLKIPMFTDFYIKIFKQSPEFSLYSDLTLKQLSLKIRETSYSPGETIFLKGQIERKVYFLKQGLIDIFDTDKK